MRELGKGRSLLLRIGMVAVLVIVLQIGYACLQLSKLDVPSQNVNSIKVLWNPFFSSSQASLANIDEKVQDVRQRASYEAFLRSQTIDSKSLVTSVRDKINLQPFAAELWGDLVWVESLAKEKEEKRLASIEAAIKLGGWNYKYYLSLTAFCLGDPPALLKHDPKLCRSLVNNMPHSSLAANARDMGVHHAYLTSRIDDLAAVYGLRPSKHSN